MKGKKTKEEVLEEIKNTKKPAIIIRVPGFESSNSGPGPARRDIPDTPIEDDQDSTN